VLARNLVFAVKNSEMVPGDNDQLTDLTQSQDVTSDVQCLRQVDIFVYRVHWVLIKALKILEFSPKIQALENT